MSAFIKMSWASFSFQQRKAFYTQNFEIPWSSDQSQAQVQKLPKIQTVLNSDEYGDLNSPTKMSPKKQWDQLIAIFAYTVKCIS